MNAPKKAPGDDEAGIDRPVSELKFELRQHSYKRRTSGNGSLWTRVATFVTGLIH